MTETRSSVSLPQYAAVRAALAEDFPLGEILSTEGITGPDWQEANAAWTERVATDPETFASFARELADAEDRFSREVTPIDSDVAAWVSFLAAFEPDVREETMRKTGLRMTDVSRLVRRWGRRAQKEPDVGKQLGELRARIEEAGKAEMPSIRVEPLALKRPMPARALAAPEGAGAVGQKNAAGEPLRLDQYAALLAELTATTSEKARVLAKHGLSPEAFAKLESMWTTRFEDDPTARLDFKRLLAHQRTKRRDWGAATRAPAPEPVAQAQAPGPTVEQYASLCTELGLWPQRTSEILARYGLTETTRQALDTAFAARMAADAGLLEAWRRASRTYRAWLTRGRGPGASDSPAPPAPAEDVAGTADITAFVPREALPFTKGAAAPAVVAVSAPAARSGPPAPPAGSGTEDITSFVPREALPFTHPAAAPAPAAGHPPLARPDPPAPRAPSEDVGGTADISAFVPRGELPFLPPAGAPDAAATADISAFVPRGELPFAKPAGPEIPVVARAPAEPASPPPPAPGSRTEDISAFVPRPALPFGEDAGARAAPAAPAAAAPFPRMRLVRFDPQTGQPLAEPRWEEMPPGPSGGTAPKR